MKDLGFTNEQVAKNIKEWDEEKFLAYTNPKAGDARVINLQSIVSDLYTKKLAAEFFNIKTSSWDPKLVMLAIGDERYWTFKVL